MSKTFILSRHKRLVREEYPSITVRRHCGKPDRIDRITTEVVNKNIIPSPHVPAIKYLIEKIIEKHIDPRRTKFTLHQIETLVALYISLIAKEKAENGKNKRNVKVDYINSALSIKAFRSFIMNTFVLNDEKSLTAIVLAFKNIDTKKGFGVLGVNVSTFVYGLSILLSGNKWPSSNVLRYCMPS